MNSFAQEKFRDHPGLSESLREAKTVHILIRKSVCLAR